MVKIGVVGGGQLARMMIPASINLGFRLSVFSEQENSSASLATALVGDYKKLNELLEFVSQVDVLTFDHEHVPLEILTKVREVGVAVRPSPEALALTQNKVTMRRRLEEIGISQPKWTVLSKDSDPIKAVEAVGGFPCVAKMPVGGYDGRGVRVVNSLAECEDWIDSGEVLLEEFVAFKRELSQLSARRPGGEWRAWPVVETHQVGGVCSEVVAGPIEIEGKLSTTALEIAKLIAEKVEVAGVLAVELFETEDGQLLVNELAMRPHNSGHVFTELSRTSQFEQHLRAVADVPLGSTEFLTEFGAMANVFGGVSLERQSLAWKSFPEAKIHSYQKSPRPGRKAGHVVVVGTDLDFVLAQTRGARGLVEVES